MVPTSMTLDDLERRDGLYFAFLSPNSIALQANYITMVESRPVMSVKHCLPVPVFHFWPKLTHSAARSLCDSRASCCYHLCATSIGEMKLCFTAQREGETA